MTINGISKMISLLKISYPQTYCNFPEEDLKIFIKQWEIHFNGVSDEEMYKAVQLYIDNNTYPPTIAHLKEILWSSEKEKRMTSEEAWALVLKAGSNGIHGSLNEWEKLPAELQRIVTPQTIYEIGVSNQNDLKYMKRYFMDDYKKVEENYKKEFLISTMKGNREKVEKKENEYLSIENKTTL